MRRWNNVEWNRKRWPLSDVLHVQFGAHELPLYVLIRLCTYINVFTFSSHKLKVSVGLVWLIGAMVCLLASSWVQLSVSAGNGPPLNNLLYHWLMQISCHFWDCKALLVTSLTHVNGAITRLIVFYLRYLTWNRVRGLWLGIQLQLGKVRVKVRVRVSLGLAIVCNIAIETTLCVEFLSKKRFRQTDRPQTELQTDRPRLHSFALW